MHPEFLAASRSPNGFENLVVDVPELYGRHPVDRPADLGLAWDTAAERLYASGLLPLKARNHSWHLLRRLKLDLSWFERFRRYWGKVLGGRPLWGVEDFYFLRNVYRIRFQNAAVADDADSAGHVAAWQQPEVLSHLFHSAYKESMHNELRLLRPLRELHRGPVRRILEFGCGSAPVTTSLCEFAPLPRGVEAWISDIETVPFHYAAHKLAPFKNVHAVPLRPEARFQFASQEKFDAIFCMTVFEHLPEPIATLKHLHSLLAPGGLFFFDYVKSDAGGLDTRAGLDQRPAVLSYIREHFRLLRGSMEEAGSIGLTIVTPR